MPRNYHQNQRQEAEVFIDRPVATGQWKKSAPLGKIYKTRGNLPLVTFPLLICVYFGTMEATFNPLWTL